MGSIQGKYRISAGTLSRLISTTSAIAIGIASMAVPALAQQEVDLIEEIIVTGSHVRRMLDYESPSPIQTLGATEIANTGAVRVQDIFKGLTVNSGSQISNRQNTRQGISQFSLRGLGLGSTLTLINGRRAGLSPVTDETGTLFTDVNQYPLNMIQRIEVLTDGASATYGSEAVAGVVNLITRKNFEGLELIGEVRDSTHTSYQIGGAFGASFDRGRFSIFASHYNQGGNFRGDFDFIRDNLTFSSSTGSPGSYRRAEIDPMTGLVISAIDNRDVGGATQFEPDADCAAVNAGFEPLNSPQIDSRGRCRYNFINQRRLIAEENRFQVFSQFDYDITDRVEFFSELSYSRNEIRDALGGAVNRTGPINGDFIIPASHPFNFYVDNGSGGIVYADPVTNQAAWEAGTLTAVDITARFRPLGSRFDGPNAEDIITIFNNVRISSGFDIELSDNWNVLASYTYSNSEFQRREPRNWAVDLLQDFLMRGAWNPFGTALANPGLVSPKDGTSTAANNDETFAQFNRVKTETGRVSQTVAEVVLSGDLGEWFGSPVGVAVGGQYRDVIFEDFPDGLSGVLEGGREDPTFPVTGSQDVFAVFAELAVPIRDRIDMQFALRYEDYGTQGGDTLDPKIAIRFNVWDELAVRGSFGTSFQAPSIRQIAGAVGNAGIDDPLDETGGTFNVVIFTKGSADLSPQSATNFNLGFVYQSEFGLVLSADFWHYKYKDLILPGESAQSIVNNDPNDPRVLRDGSGQLTGVVTEFLNRGSAIAEGIDLRALYTLELQDMGTLAFDASTTIITKYRSSDFDGLDGLGNLKGSRNANNAFGSVPDLKINAGMTWNYDIHGFNVSVRHIGSYTDDQSGATIKSQTTFDARYSLYLAGLIGGNDTVLTVGVVNFTNEDPPLIPIRPGLDTEVHDPRGRQIYASIKQSF